MDDLLQKIDLQDRINTQHIRELNSSSAFSHGRNSRPVAINTAVTPHNKFTLTSYNQLMTSQTALPKTPAEMVDDGTQAMVAEGQEDTVVDSSHSNDTKYFNQGEHESERFNSGMANGSI